MQTVLLRNQNEFVLEPKEDTLYLVLLDKETKQGKVKVDLLLKKSDLNCQLLFLGRSQKKSNWQLESNIKHFVARTSCLTEVYLSLADQSKVDYFGQIYIDKNAEQTKSFLKEQSLIMGSSIYNRSRPILEIFNNRVKASHSASCSRISETDLFYLMSRGFEKSEAEEILEKAFFDQILESVKVKEAHTLIGEYLC